MSVSTRPPSDFESARGSPEEQEPLVDVLRAGAQQRQRLEFGEFFAEVEAGRCLGLFRGYEPIGLSEMPRKVLFSLLEQRPAPVLTKRLLSELWPPGANASNLAKQVRALRLALGDEASQRYIRTLNKEGYAFVMPVTSSSREALAGSASLHAEAPGHVERVLASTSLGDAAALSRTEWRLATEKLTKDFRGSCLHDLERLTEAIEECDSRIHLIAEHHHLQLGDRFPRGPLQVPRRPTPGWPAVSAEEPDAELAASASDLIRHSKTTPVVVNVGSYSPACISVLQSLRRRYELGVRCDFEGLSGRQQILKLFHDDEADFLFAPHVPFLLVGDYGALDYRRVTPVHAYEQILLRAPGAVRGRKRRLLVYKGGYPEEQLLARVGIPVAAVPEMVSSFETLVEKVAELGPGDMVIARDPPASGLESKNTFTRVAEYRCWLSLYCHERWQRGALGVLKSQFAQLFAAEWTYCRTHRDWAAECLRLELSALELFTAGSGLRPGL